VEQSLPTVPAASQHFAQDLVQASGPSYKECRAGREIVRHFLKIFLPVDNQALELIYEFGIAVEWLNRAEPFDGGLPVDT
jgi:hypothetical protein